MKDDVVTPGQRISNLVTYFLDDIESRKTSGCPKHSSDSMGVNDLTFLIKTLSILHPPIYEWNRIALFVLGKAAKCLDYSHHYTDITKTLSSHVSPEVKASIVMHFVANGAVEAAIFASAQSPSSPLSPSAIVNLATHHRENNILSTHCDWAKLLELAENNKWALAQVQRLHAEARHCEKNRRQD